MLGKDGEVNMSVNVVCLSNGQVLKRVTVLMVPGKPVDESPVGKADKLVFNPPVLFIVINKSRHMVYRGPRDSSRSEGMPCYLSDSEDD